jgi:hypothetical protein
MWTRCRALPGGASARPRVLAYPLANLFPTRAELVRACVYLHQPRRLMHFYDTEHPAADWTLQQLREALPGDREYKFLLHDRHKTFSAGLDEEVASWRIEVLKSTPHAPAANAFCER